MKNCSECGQKKPTPKWAPIQSHEVSNAEKIKRYDALHNKIVKMWYDAIDDDRWDEDNDHYIYEDAALWLGKDIFNQDLFR